LYSMNITHRHNDGVKQVMNTSIKKACTIWTAESGIPQSVNYFFTE
jgi:hypothetical protein